MGDVSSNQIDSQNDLLNMCDASLEEAYGTSVEEDFISRIFCQFFNRRIEDFQVFILSILFIMSGLTLFINGIFGRDPYQFIVAFFFLVSGFILENLKE